jgi:hypothetical protein
MTAIMLSSLVHSSYQLFSQIYDLHLLAGDAGLFCYLQLLACDAGFVPVRSKWLL